MSARTHSGSGLIGWLFGFAVLVALGAALLLKDGRQAPIRTAELSIPLPQLPDPPAMPPRSNDVFPPAP